MPTQVYTGIWTDHSLPSARSLTLTLSSRDGTLLLAFISAFVTIVAGQLWSIVCFVLHQAFTADPHVYHDGLFFQRQNILRNSATPYGAAWSFLLQAWSWRGRAEKVKRRTLVWAVGACLYALAFAVAAVFSSQISGSASPARLLRSTEGCGYWSGTADATFEVPAYPIKRTQDTTVAVAYARMCYGDMSGETPAGCKSLPKPRLEYTFTTEDISCPFGKNACWKDLAVRMETKLLDSRDDLGINAPNSERLQLTQSAVCAPLITKGYLRDPTVEDSTWLPTSPQDYVIYDYGQTKPAGSDAATQNFTHYYNKLASITGQTYSAPQYSFRANGTTSGWLPKPEFWSETADVSLVLVEFNSVMFAERTEDAIFLATEELRAPSTNELQGYLANDWISPVACYEQLQICNPVNGNCTAWRGRGNSQASARSDLLVNHAQEATLSRLFYATSHTQIAGAIYTRIASALRAQDTLFSTVQLPLPRDQWHIELRSWFEESLALLQQQVQEYATGPVITRGSTLVQHWTNTSLPQKVREAYRSLCDNQVTLNAQGTISFSVLGIAILFSIGAIIIVLSLTIESLASYLRSRSGRGRYKTWTWDSNANLSVQQMLLEARGYGAWDSTYRTVPTTDRKQTFPGTSVLHSRFDSKVRTQSKA